MTGAIEKAAEHLREITECPICMSVFTDPRMLPCIHTFCFECLSLTGEADQKKPGDKIPCPLCRKEFIIPEDGMHGVQKNFFMENLLLYKTTLRMGSTTIICDICDIRNKGKTGQVPKATMRCMECQDNYCEGCAEIHQLQKVSKDHQMVNIGSDMKSEKKRLVSKKTCTKHIHKPLDYYCSDCKKVVCVSCFVESHKLHDCKDVTTVDEEFRQEIGKEAWKVSTYVKEMLQMRNNNENKNSDFQKEIVEKEKEIRKRNQEIKDMIDRHTEILLNELSVIKSKHLKEMENQKEEIERYRTIFESFDAYCTEIISTGSASDICSSVDQIIVRAGKLERDHEAFIGRPHQSVEVSFQATDLGFVFSASSNFVGKVEGKMLISKFLPGLYYFTNYM